jgi:Antitoxin VbhA
VSPWKVYARHRWVPSPVWPKTPKLHGSDANARCSKTLASSRLEGVAHSPDFDGLAERYIAGEITTAEIRESLREPLDR